MVQQYVLNQTWGYWLWSDALVIAMRIFMKLWGENNQNAIGTLPLQCGDFDSELEIFYARILAAQVVAILVPSFDFVVHFNYNKIHNMMAIMLDPRFKGI